MEGGHRVHPVVAGVCVFDCLCVCVLVCDDEDGTVLQPGNRLSVCVCVCV